MTDEIPLEDKPSTETPTVSETAVVAPPPFTPPVTLVQTAPPPPEPEPEEERSTPVEPVMKKFKLLSGTHSLLMGRDERGNGIRKKITAGDIVASLDNLCEIFPNRFQLVTEDDERRAKMVTAQKRNPSPRVKKILSGLEEHEKATGSERPKLRIVNRQGDKYDVVREDNGLPVNDKFLTFEEAKALEASGAPELT